MCISLIIVDVKNLFTYLPFISLLLRMLFISFVHLSVVLQKLFNQTLIPPHLLDMLSTNEYHPLGSQHVRLGQGMSPYHEAHGKPSKQLLSKWIGDLENFVKIAARRVKKEIQIFIIFPTNSGQHHFGWN